MIDAVLSRAADHIDRRGWTPERTHRSDDQRITSLQAVTLAVDELVGTGPDSTDALETAFDAVCLHVYGQRCGSKPAISVSAWNSRTARAAGRNRHGPYPAVTNQTAAEVAATLRTVGQALTVEHTAAHPTAA